MSPNEAVQYVEDDSFSADHGVTTTARRKSESVKPSYEKFWQEYYSTVDRSSVDRLLEDKIQPQLKEFTQYSVGWDSYNALPLRHDTAAFALSVLNSVMKSQTPLPHVAPTSDGGLQLDWHEKGIDLELHIAAPYDCDLWFRDNHDSNAQPISIKLANADLSPLTAAIDLLTCR